MSKAVTLTVAMALGLATMACGGVSERYRVNFTCAGIVTVSTVTVTSDSPYGARYQAVAQVERACGLGSEAYTIGAAEVATEGAGN